MATTTTTSGSPQALSSIAIAASIASWSGRCKYRVIIAVQRPLGVSEYVCVQSLTACVPFVIHLLRNHKQVFPIEVGTELVWEDRRMVGSKGYDR